MSFAKITDRFINVVGRLLLGNKYALPNWQQSSEDNPVDYALGRARKLVNGEQPSIEARILDIHRTDLRRRGLNLELYLIEACEDGHKLVYTLPGRSILLAYGISPTELESLANAEGQIRRRSISPDSTSLAREVSIGLINWESDYKPDPGDPPVRQEFKDSSSDIKGKVVYRLMLPYEMMVESEWEIYHRFLQEIFDPRHNITLFKAVAIADDVSDFLRSKKTGPNQQYQEQSLTLYKVPAIGKVKLREVFEEIFERHHAIDNETYTKEVLKKH